MGKELPNTEQELTVKYIINISQPTKKFDISMCRLFAYGQAYLKYINEYYYRYGIEKVEEIIETNPKTTCTTLFIKVTLRHRNKRV